MTLNVRRAVVKMGMNNYRSKYEQRFAKQCKKRFEYESVKLNWQPPVKKYLPDFVFQKKDGGTMFVELKGVLTVSDRTKLKSILKQHEGIDLRIIFQRAANKIGKGSKTTYGDWADSVGMKWSEGELMPVGWLKEII